jgi:hypothetical protein
MSLHDARRNAPPDDAPHAQAAAFPPLTRLDLRGRVPSAEEAATLAAAVEAGGLVEIELLTPVEAAALAEDLLALQRARVPAGEECYSQVLAGEGGAAYNWGTAAGEGADLLDLAGHRLLARVAAGAAAVARALAGEAPAATAGPLLSMVPALRKTRTFPRFFHRDSHRSVDELDAEGAARPSDYAAVWDLGLEHSSDILDVAFAPRASLAAPDGGVAPRFRRLFQLQDLDFRNLSDAEIDAIQPQMREEALPFPDHQRRLAPGRAFLWHDDRWFHSTYLRRGRRVEELAERPRSILVIRAFAGDAHRSIPWSEPARAVLPAVLGGRDPRSA